MDMEELRLRLSQGIICSLLIFFFHESQTRGGRRETKLLPKCPTIFCNLVSGVFCLAGRNMIAKKEARGLICRAAKKKRLKRFSS